MQNSTQDTIFSERFCHCGNPVEIMVFSSELSPGGQRFTTWKAGGYTCQPCADAQDFLTLLK